MTVHILKVRNDRKITNKLVEIIKDFSNVKNNNKRLSSHLIDQIL
jgi:hypothetical protein